VIIHRKECRNHSEEDLLEKNCSETMHNVYLNAHYHNLTAYALSIYTEGTLGCRSEEHNKTLQATLNSGNELNNKQLLAPLPNKAEKYIYSDNTYDLHSGGARFEY
jgi:hypothetical protein